MNRNIVNDNRRLESTSCGSGLVGMNYSKSQTGGDDYPRKTTPQPYSMSMSSTLNNVGMYKNVSGGSWHTGASTTCGFAPTASIPAFSDNERNALLLKILQKARGDTFYPSMFLAEAQGTIDQINDAAKRLAMAYRSTRRLEFNRALNYLTGLRRPPQGVVRRFGNDFTSNWLALQWGWLPLVSDIAQAGNAIVNRSAPPSRIVKTFRIRDQKDGIVYGVGGGFSAIGDAYRTLQLLLAVKQVNYSSPANANLWDVSQVAWELTPFSMIVDYFLPIGAALEARAIAEELVATLVTTECTFRKLEMGTSSSWLTSNMIHKHRGVTLSRTVGSPGASVRMPVVENGLSKRRVLNGLSLLYQMVKSK